MKANLKRATRVTLILVKNKLIPKSQEFLKVKVFRFNSFLLLTFLDVMTQQDSTYFDS